MRTKVKRVTKFCCLVFRYDATMPWAVAGTHLSEPAAWKAQKRLAPFCRPGTTFSVVAG